jgi:hypothetical protein
MSESRDERIVGVLVRLDARLRGLLTRQSLTGQPGYLVGYRAGVRAARAELLLARRDFEPEGWRPARGEWP